MDKKQQELIRQWLEGRFERLNVGDTDLSKLSDDDLWGMVEELEDAQRYGKLDLETEQGLTELQEITEKYLDKE